MLSNELYAGIRKGGSGVERTDETLYQAYLKTGDQDALRFLLERHREGLTLFLFGFVRSAEDAEELMLDAFAEVAAGPTVFSGKSSFKTWLFSIGKHLAMKRLRRERREIPWEELPTQEDEVLPETQLLQEERKRALYLGLERIAPEYREVLLLQYMEEMAPAEIAQVTGKRVKQIYNLTERGKNALRVELDRMGFAHEEY